VCLLVIKLQRKRERERECKIRIINVRVLFFDLLSFEIELLVTKMYQNFKEKKKKNNEENYFSWFCLLKMGEKKSH
jgi:hypothetical protein